MNSNGRSASAERRLGSYTPRPSCRSPIAVKVYAVLQRINVARGDQPNSRIIAVRLTKRGADVVVDRNPGTWIERHVAVKD